MRIAGARDSGRGRFRGHRGAAARATRDRRVRAGAARTGAATGGGARGRRRRPATRHGSTLSERRLPGRSARHRGDAAGARRRARRRVLRGPGRGGGRPGRRRRVLRRPRTGGRRADPPRAAEPDRHRRGGGAAWASCAWSSPSAGRRRSTRRCCPRRRGRRACSAAARPRSPCSPRRRASRADGVIDNADIAAAREVVDRYAGIGPGAHPHDRPPEPRARRARADGRVVGPAAARRAGRCTRCGTRRRARPAAGTSTTRPATAFLDRVSELGPRIVCAHKGLAGPIPSLAPGGGLTARHRSRGRAYPDIDFVVYHSGYDIDADERGGRARRRPAARA